jgi:hypothetical protein
MNHKLQIPKVLKTALSGLLFLVFATLGFSQNPAFQVSSIAGGLVAPSMTQNQRTSITTPATGSLVYQTDFSSGYYYYNGTTWLRLLPSVDLSSNVTGVLPIANGGTNTTSTPTAGGVAYGTGTAYAITSPGTAGNVLISGGAGAPTWGDGSGSFILNQSAASQTANFNISGNGTLGGNINVNGGNVNGPGISGGTSGLIRINSNTDVRVALDADNNGSQQFEVTPGGSVSPIFYVTEAGNVTANGSIRMLETGATPTFFTALQSGDLTSTITFTLPTSVGTNGQVLTTNGAGALSWSTPAASGVTSLTSTSPLTTNTAATGAVTVNLTGIVPVANGGTGLNTITANGLMVGNGTANVGTIAPGTSGNVLVSNGTSWSSGDASGSFILNQTAVNQTGNFRISGNGLVAGNVGIGTIAPSAPLDVIGNSATPFDIVKASGSNTIGSAILLSSSAAGGRSWDIISTANAAGEGAGKLLFKDMSVGSGVRMTIDGSSGNVGIGTTGPATALDVNGVANAATGFRVANAAASGSYLRGNGTNFVSSTIQSADIPDLSATYIKNQTTQQATSNFNISGNGTIGGTFTTGSTTIAPLTYPINHLTNGGGGLLLGSGRNGDPSVKATKAGSWTRIGGASGLSFWANGNSDVDDNPQFHISSTGAVAFGGSANTGTSGQVLTSAGSGAVPTWAAMGALLNIQVLTTSGTYTPTSGTSRALVILVGGGGGGGGCGSTTNSAYNYNFGAGGGSGGCVYAFINNVSGNYVYTIGAAGTAGAVAAAGGNGGNTTFTNGATVYTAGGGGGGSAVTNATAAQGAGGAGGTAANGILNIPGAPGLSGHIFGTYNAIAYGNAGSGAGANSIFGSGGRAPAAASGARTVGNAGTGYGSGGSGGISNGAIGTIGGGAGTAGVIVIYEYK